MRCFVFCDFSKAFDNVWHRGLLHKLKAYGINGNVLDWFHSYLNEREQRVVSKDASSSFTTILGGVPQSSVPAPLLFIIYINDIADKLTSLTRLCADDTSFTCSHSEETEIQSIINHDLKELDEWSKRWLLTFNPDKTALIMLFANLEHPEINFTFEDNIISTIESHRHLVVAFSTDAKWNAHIENIVSSVSKHITILRTLKFKMNRSNLEKNIYLVYIMTIFEYASEVWDNCGSVNASKLERL